MKRAIKLSIGAAFAALAITIFPFAAGADDQTFSGNAYSTDAPAASQANVDANYAIVQFTGAPVLGNSGLTPGHGKRVDLNGQPVKNYRAQLAAERNAFTQWLQSNYPSAVVTGGFDIALNAVSVQLNGTPLNALLGGPNVSSAEYEGLYYPTGDATIDPDLTDINAFNALGNSQPNAGTGIKVAMIDTGIDITNPCFSDAGYSKQTQLGDKNFTNNKVIVARVFRYHRGNVSYTPAPDQEHGTHTAGTVGCDGVANPSVNGVTIPHTFYGVAPHALLGNYNVFPGTVTNARNEDIFKALQQAYEDGMNIDNMSLGGGYKGSQDILMAQVDRFDRAGMLSAVAAGNSGPGFGTVSSPGAAEDALTAGASTVGQIVANTVTVSGQNFAGVPGDFGTISSPLTAALAVVPAGSGAGVDGLSRGCAAADFSTSITGDIALLSRGSCSFSTKLRNAQAAGAAAVVMANTVAGDPIVMGQDGTPNQPTIPGWMVTTADGATLAGFNGDSTTISPAGAYFSTGNDNFMASFSGQGPTNVDYRVKPDVVAPGVNVLSSIPAAFCSSPPCYAFFQGTSMATPHLAGSAAVVEWQHPGWNVDQVRSAIVNTANWGVLKSSSGTPNMTNPLIAGAGLEDLNSALHATVALDPVSISFGGIPGSSSQSEKGSLTLSNLTGSAENLNLVVTDTKGSGLTFAVAPSSVSIPAGGSSTVQVTETPSGAAVGSHYGVLRISSGGSEVAHAELFTQVLPN